MATITADRAGFRGRFSEFVSRTDEDVDAALEFAKHIHTVRPLATLYLAAHALSLAASAQIGGEVIEDQVGAIRSKYMAQAQSGDEVFYTRTEYGRRFLVLEKRTPRVAIGAVVVG